MGCDIHTNIEYRKPVNSKPVWTDGNEYGPNEDFGAYPEASEFMQINEICGNRDYQLFAVLANVRNYYEDQITPLSQPRGIPTDSCEAIKAKHECWDCDAHSTSYYTLAELVQALPNYPILQELVDALLERYKVLLPQDAPLITYNDLRFVFWFDN